VHLGKCAEVLLEEIEGGAKAFTDLLFALDRGTDGAHDPYGVIMLWAKPAYEAFLARLVYPSNDGFREPVLLTRTL
jgi:hypothetical protein